MSIINKIGTVVNFQQEAAARLDGAFSRDEENYKQDESKPALGLGIAGMLGLALFGSLNIFKNRMDQGSGSKSEELRKNVELLEECLAYQNEQLNNLKPTFVYEGRTYETETGEYFRDIAKTEFQLGELYLALEEHTTAVEYFRETIKSFSSAEYYYTKEDQNDHSWYGLYKKEIADAKIYIFKAYRLSLEAERGLFEAWSVENNGVSVDGAMDIVAWGYATDLFKDKYKEINQKNIAIAISEGVGLEMNFFPEGTSLIREGQKVNDFAFEYALKTGSKEVLAKAYLDKALICEVMGRPKDALESVGEAAKVITEDKENPKMFVLMERLLARYPIHPEYKSQLLNVFEMALPLATSEKDLNSLQNILSSLEKMVGIGWSLGIRKEILYKTVYQLKKPGRDELYRYLWAMSNKSNTTPAEVYDVFKEFGDKIKEESNNPYVMEILSKLYVNAGLYEKGVRCLTQAIATFSDFDWKMDARLRRGELYLKMNQPMRALEDLVWLADEYGIVSFDRRSPDIRKGLAEAAVQLFAGHFGDVPKDVLRSIVLGENDFEKETKVIKEMWGTFYKQKIRYFVEARLSEIKSQVEKAVAALPKVVEQPVAVETSQFHFLPEAEQKRAEAAYVKTLDIIKDHSLLPHTVWFDVAGTVVDDDKNPNGYIIGMMKAFKDANVKTGLYTGGDNEYVASIFRSSPCLKDLLAKDGTGAPLVREKGYLDGLRREIFSRLVGIELNTKLALVDELKPVDPDQILVDDNRELLNLIQSEELKNFDTELQEMLKTQKEQLVFVGDAKGELNDGVAEGLEKALASVEQARQELTGENPLAAEKKIFKLWPSRSYDEMKADRDSSTAAPAVKSEPIDAQLTRDAAMGLEESLKRLLALVKERDRTITEEGIAKALTERDAKKLETLGLKEMIESPLRDKLAATIKSRFVEGLGRRDRTEDVVKRK